MTSKALRSNAIELTALSDVDLLNALLDQRGRYADALTMERSDPFARLDSIVYADNVSMIRETVLFRLDIRNRRLSEFENRIKAGKLLVAEGI